MTCLRFAMRVNKAEVSSRDFLCQGERLDTNWLYLRSWQTSGICFLSGPLGWPASLHILSGKVDWLLGSFPVFSWLSFAASTLRKGLCKQFTRPILKYNLIGSYCLGDSGSASYEL